MRIGMNAVVAAVGVAALSQFASAADLPVKARPAPVYAPAYNWTGWYVGANAGYHISRDSITNSGELLADEVTVQSSPGTLSRQGGLVGAQIGYNWQVAPTWLLGVEADWQWLGGHSSLCTGECFDDDFLKIETKVNWLATFRGRLGWIHNDYLWYVTGGAAMGRAKLTVEGFDIDTSNSALTTLSTTQNKWGWTVGGGVETLLWQNWSAKLEYLYVDLGTISASGDTLINTSNFVVTDAKIRDHIFRVGLNYRFGSY